MQSAYLAYPNTIIIKTQQGDCVAAASQLRCSYLAAATPLCSVCVMPTRWLHHACMAVAFSLRSDCVTAAWRLQGGSVMATEHRNGCVVSTENC